MYKFIFIFSIALLQIYHNSVSAYSFGRIFQKTEKEAINKEYPMNEKCTITVHNTEGSITIKAWPQNKLLIEAQKKGTAEDQKNTTISAKATGNEASIITRIPEQQKSSMVDYVLMVPEQANLKITQTSGPIKIRGVQGSVDISIVEQGLLEVIDSSKTVTATTNAGDIIVQQKKFGQPHSLFLKTDRGNITLSIPRETKASFHAKTLTGSIISDHPVTATFTSKLNKEAWERMKKEVEGSLGGLDGGAPITLEATKGMITLKEY